MLTAIGCGPAQSTPTTDQSSEQELVVGQIVDSEELLLALNTKLGALKRSALNLVLPDPLGRSLFADKVEFSAWDFTTSTPEAAKSKNRDQLNIWPSELKQINFPLGEYDGDVSIDG